MGASSFYLIGLGCQKVRISLAGQFRPLDTLILIENFVEIAYKIKSPPGRIALRRIGKTI